jgi:ABC-type multidrug transport system fused ATPase/permease subunit
MPARDAGFEDSTMRDLKIQQACRRKDILDGGEILEMGTHEELMALGGRYATLFELQAAAYR